MNLPLPELFYWGSRPKTLCHHLRWQKFLQQITIKQQRQGSPHTACWAVICQHTLQNPSPAPGVDAKCIHWWVQNTEQPPPHAVLWSLPGLCQHSQAPFPCSQWTEDPQHWAPACQVFTEVQQDTGIPSRSAFPVSPKHEQGIHPSSPGWELKAVGKLPSLASRGLVTTHLSCGSGSLNWASGAAIP